MAKQKQLRDLLETENLNQQEKKLLSAICRGTKPVLHGIMSDIMKTLNQKDVSFDHLALLENRFHQILDTIHKTAPYADYVTNLEAQIKNYLAYLACQNNPSDNNVIKAQKKLEKLQEVIRINREKLIFSGNALEQIQLKFNAITQKIDLKQDLITQLQDFEISLAELEKQIHVLELADSNFLKIGKELGVNYQAALLSQLVALKVKTEKWLDTKEFNDTDWFLFQELRAEYQRLKLFGDQDHYRFYLLVKLNQGLQKNLQELLDFIGEQDCQIASNSFWDKARNSSKIQRQILQTQVKQPVNKVLQVINKISKAKPAQSLQYLNEFEENCQKLNTRLEAAKIEFYNQGILFPAFIQEIVNFIRWFLGYAPSEVVRRTDLLDNTAATIDATIKQHHFFKPSEPQKPAVSKQDAHDRHDIAACDQQETSYLPS